MNTLNSTIWNDAAPLISKLHALQESGYTTLIKIDGERTSGIFTIMIMGKKLQGEFFRKDTDDLLGTLREAIAYHEKYAMD